MTHRFSNVIRIESEEFLPTPPLKPDAEGSLPLVIEAPSSEIDICAMMAAHQAKVGEYLDRYGALLFKACSLNDETSFAKFSSSFGFHLFTENGEHIKTSMNDNVFTPIEYASNRKLLWHNENSFNHAWPTRILFGCLKPADQGGETPIVDARKLYSMIDPDTRARFEDRQVMYVRNYGEDLGLPWQAVFGTTDRAVVEDKCQAARMSWTWKGGDRLMTQSIRPASVRHPGTGEMTWFNQAQHWHLACLDDQTRTALTNLFAVDDLPRNCRFGDGADIADEDIAHILECYQALEISFPWQRGDAMVLDNLNTAHARNPYKGKRQLVVSMGAVSSYDRVSAS